MERGITRTYRRRYVAFKVYSPRPLRRNEVATLLKSTLDEKAPNTTLLTYNPEKMNGILRCDHRNLNTVRSLLNSPLQSSVHITTLKTSGTLKALRTKLPELSRSEKRGPQA
jgi:RNase P/RNase MRP subunit POP5